MSYTPKAIGMLKGDNVDITVTVAEVGTYYEVGNGFTAGILSDVDFQNSNGLVCKVSGDYSVVWNMSLVTASANDEIEGEIMINGTATENGGSAHANLINSNKPQTIASQGLIHLNVGDIVTLAVKNVTSATNIVVNHGNLILMLR